MLARQRAAAIFMVVLSCYTGVFIVNIGLSIIPDRPNEATKREEGRKKYDNELIASAKASGFKPLLNPNAIVPFIKQNPDSEWYPVGGHQDQDTYYCNEGYGLIKYKSDRLGLRNDDQAWSEIENGTPTALFIGDSFTHGACVEDQYSLTSVFKEVHKTNVVNLGIGGNSPYEYIASLKLLGKPLVKRFRNIKMVVLVFYANDNIGSNKKSENILLNPVLPLNSSDLLNGKIAISSTYADNFNKVSELIYAGQPNPDSFVEHLKTYFFIRNLRARLFPFMAITNIPSNFELSPTGQAISSLSKVCSKQCQPIIAYIPNSNFWRPDSRSDEYRNLIQRHAQKRKIPFVDASVVIDHNDLSDYAPIGPHLSRAGYTKVGKLISSKLHSLAKLAD